MKISITKKTWKIPKPKLKIFDKEEIEKFLQAINLACSGEFYMVDYFREKIFVNSPSSLILCGHPKELMEQKGFGFYYHILKKDEWGWIMQMNAAAYKTVFNFSEHQRINCVVSYDLTLQTINDNELVLHHKVVPYKLCNNGNVWLALCHVTRSSAKQVQGVAHITNMTTGARYDFIKNKFALSKIEVLSNEETQILEWMVKDISPEQICGLLAVSISNFKRRRQNIYKKLGVNTPAGAIHKAHLMGII
ncbi:MAG: LuxR C-terminal-related transcriptional regulator [Bacteroidales bacterium]|jgi:DNA-binding CsgD family transcriptional regulator|nr:LuxR C-terminal-related transcriptional regulator [Bacteroidales bacterium]